jgi:hypothetical protein
VLALRDGRLVEHEPDRLAFAVRAE